MISEPKITRQHLRAEKRREQKVIAAKVKASALKHRRAFNRAAGGPVSGTAEDRYTKRKARLEKSEIERAERKLRREMRRAAASSTARAGGE